MDTSTYFDHDTSAITIIKKNKSRPPRNLLSSSESESSLNAFSEDQHSGIAHESASGINLCEVDSLKDCLTPRGSDDHKNKREPTVMKYSEEENVPGLSEVSVPDLTVSPNESLELVAITIPKTGKPDTNNNNNYESSPPLPPKSKPEPIRRQYKEKSNSVGPRKIIQARQAEHGYLAKSKLKEAFQRPKVSELEGPRRRPPASTRPPQLKPASCCQKRVIPVEESLKPKQMKPDPPNVAMKSRSKSKGRYDQVTNSKPATIASNRAATRKIERPLNVQGVKPTAVKTVEAAPANLKNSSDVFVDALEGSNGEIRDQPPPSHENSEPSDLINSCTRTFMNMFHLHVDESAAQKRQELKAAEVPQSSGVEYASSEEEPEAQQQAQNNTSKKISDFKLPTPKASLHARQRSLQQIPHEDPMEELLRPGWRWEQSPDVVDVLLVKINLGSSDGQTSEETRKDVVLKFPLHKDDLYSSMVIVQNPMLIDQKVQYIHAPSELMYRVPPSVKTCVKIGIGTFRIRSALNIPVTFKLARVKNLELIPNVGVILPEQSITIRLHYAFRPGLANLEALKLEGVLVYAAPFVFNKGCGPSNVKLEDVLEFWGKFPGPRFQYAQTKFVQLRVMCQDQLLRTPSTNIFSRIWSAFKSLKFIKHVPGTAGLPDYSSKLLNDEKLSPLGKMILRRRQAILLDIKETSNRVTETRAFLAMTVLLFASGYTMYYYYDQRTSRIELTWWTNLCQWISNLFTSIEQ